MLYYQGFHLKIKISNHIRLLFAFSFKLFSKKNNSCLNLTKKNELLYQNHLRELNIKITLVFLILISLQCESERRMIVRLDV